MPRTARVAPGDVIFHVLNRANARSRIFENERDYHALEHVMADTIQHVPVRILAYCLMPNHWHMVLWPQQDGELGAFMQRLTTTHVRRWHLHRHSVGSGHLYQGTYKSFPIQDDKHFLTVCRYVEQNALRAGLVKTAENWRWSSLWLRLLGKSEQDKPALSEWPVARPQNWVSLVNQPQASKELEAVRLSVQRGRPYGGEVWQRWMTKRLGLESTFRSRGRPHKED
ncbi:MAG: transposase [Deltaproteobacteria bacterium]|nr:transposase [Deltaproteobacteria bacterium]